MDVTFLGSFSTSPSHVCVSLSRWILGHIDRYKRRLHEEASVNGERLQVRDHVTFRWMVFFSRCKYNSAIVIVVFVNNPINRGSRGTTITTPSHHIFLHTGYCSFRRTIDKEKLLTWSFIIEGPQPVSSTSFNVSKC